HRAGLLAERRRHHRWARLGAGCFQEAARVLMGLEEVRHPCPEVGGPGTGLVEVGLSAAGRGDLQGLSEDRLDTRWLLVHDPTPSPTGLLSPSATLAGKMCHGCPKKSQPSAAPWGRSCW